MQYKIIVDKQPSSNPSSEKKEYIIDIEELRIKGNIYDSLNIEMDRTYVTRRLSLSQFGVLSVLDEPQIEELAEVNIELFEGDNYIYLMDMQGNSFYAEYLIKNDFNDIYATKNEMNSRITQTAQSIELSVNQKLEGYSTTEEMNSTITQTAQEINSEVSKKVGEDEIISKINQSAEQITINADKIDISGKAVNFQTQISQQIGPFSETDITKLRNYLMDEGTLTSDEINKYDINKDGELSASDLLLMRRAVNNGGYYTFKGTFKIDPYSYYDSITLYDTSQTTSNPEFIFSLVKTFINNLEAVSVQVNGGQLAVENAYGSMFTQENSSNGKFELIINGDVQCENLTQTSLESKKKNFEKFENALSIIKDIDIYKYNLKHEKDTDKKHIGFIIGENYKYREEVTSQDNTGVDDYSFISLCCKAIQEQQKIIEDLQEKISKLEQSINSNI